MPPRHRGVAVPAMKGRGDDAPLRHGRDAPFHISSAPWARFRLAYFSTTNSVGCGNRAAAGLNITNLLFEMMIPATA